MALLGAGGCKISLGVKVNILLLFYKPCYVPLKFGRPIKKSDPHKAHILKVELVGSSLIIVCTNLLAKPGFSILQGYLNYFFPLDVNY